MNSQEIKFAEMTQFLGMYKVTGQFLGVWLLRAEWRHTTQHKVKWHRVGKNYLSIFYSLLSSKLTSCNTEQKKKNLINLGLFNGTLLQRRENDSTISLICCTLRETRAVKTCGACVCMYLWLLPVSLTKLVCNEINNAWSDALCIQLNAIKHGKWEEEKAME